MSPYLEIWNASKTSISSWAASAADLTRNVFHHLGRVVQKSARGAIQRIPRIGGFVPARGATTAYRQRRYEEATAKAKMSLFLAVVYISRAAAAALDAANPSLKERHQVSAVLCVAALGLGGRAADLLAIRLLLWELATRVELWVGVASRTKASRDATASCLASQSGCSPSRTWVSGRKPQECCP